MAGKLFVACLATFVVLSFLWNSVAAEEEERPANKLLFDALGMELNDPRKRKLYYLVKHGRPYYGHGKKPSKGRSRKGRSSGSDSSGSSGSGSDSDSDSDSDDGKYPRHGKKPGKHHGSDSEHGSSDEAEL